jgi:predicted heme/steroid binding protein/uncharacterized membrane protein
MSKTVQEEELRASNGQEGRPAYVAYQGKVYDVSASPKWRGGQHMRRHNAGQDLTADFGAAPHDESVLGRVPLVGELVLPQPETAQPAPPEKEVPALLDRLLDRHPHPIAVHFPVAYAAAVAVFVILYLLTGNATFETAAYYLLWGGVAMAVVAAALGVLVWWFSYGHKLTTRFIGKAVLSVVFVLLGALALYMRTSDPAALTSRGWSSWLYALLVVLMALAVAGLGWIGEKIMWGK